MTQDEIFDSLAQNAFDFLTRGIEEFDKAPKYSVIHFCAAVEMLLKARLMREHWSLIVSRPEQANLSKFMAGDFMSVTLEDCRVRIRDVAGEDIGDDAYNSFRALANHRNKMVHFFHPEMDSDETAKAQIVAEHCRSWFHLHRLLSRWNNYFSAFGKEVSRADRAMKSHRKYLAAKFKALKPDLEAARARGHKLKACSACAYKAAIAHEIDDHVASLRCLVCDHAEVQVEIECPHCDKPVVIKNEGYATCRHCGSSIEPEHLADALTEDVVGTKDYFETGFPANCGFCEGYHTVVECGDSYLCTNCFDLSSQVGQCEWCNELSTGDLEYSYSSGCSQCDGKAGWEKDD